jgi:hypothetical protein
LPRLRFFRLIRLSLRHIIFAVFGHFIPFAVVASAGGPDRGYEFQKYLMPSASISKQRSGFFLEFRKPE